MTCFLLDLMPVLLLSDVVFWVLQPSIATWV